MTFDIRDHLEQLQPHPKHKRDYLCPACETGKLSIRKHDGAYRCWAGCESTHIRNALSPSCNPNAGRTQDEIEQRKQAAAEARAQQDRERERRYSRAAARAEQEWVAAVPLTEAPAELVQGCYWTRKGLKPIADVRIVLRDYRQGRAEVPQGTVLFAVRNRDGVIRSLQRIHPDGEKQNLAGGEMAHGTAVLGDLATAEVVAIAEGPATAGSIHEATGWTVLIGFSTSGLPHAAAIARELAPTAQLVFCADNDLSEAGKKAAEPLARKYGGVIAMPPTVGHDFNDYHQAEGLQAVTDALTAALEGGPVPAAEAEEAQEATTATQEAQEAAPAEADEAEDLKLDEALEELQQLQEARSGSRVVQLARRMVAATIGMDFEEADYWLKAIAKITGQRVQVLRSVRQELIAERARARYAEQQAQLEAAQKQAMQDGKLDPRLADRFLLLRLRDTDDGLDLFATDNSLTLGPDTNLGLATLQGRAVHLCWDRDLFDPPVMQQLQEKAIALRMAGADVRVEVLPRCPDTGRALTAVEVADRYGRDFLLKLAGESRSCWTRDGDFRLEPDAENTKSRAFYVTGMIGGRMVADPVISYAWSTYTGTHWREHPNDKVIRGQIHTLAEAQGWVKGRELGAFNSLVADVTRSLTRALPESHPGLVPMANGMLRISDRQLLPHSPDYGNRYCLPYAYDPNATAAPIVDFLAERLGDQARLQLFQAWLALLLRGVRPKQFVELVGESDTGKSTLTNIVCALIGAENTVSTDLQRLEDKTARFETYKLRGKRLVSIAEAHKYSGSLEVLKSLTGGDLISAEIKGSTGSADFRFGGGVIVAGNGQLYASDTSDAVVKRRITFTLGRVKGPLRDLLHWSAEDNSWRGEFAHLLPGLFNWALAVDEATALERLRNRHDISPALREQDYINAVEADPILAWADANLVLAEGHNLRIGVADNDADTRAFPNYLRHCDQARVRNPFSQRTFRKVLTSRLRGYGLDLPDDNKRDAYRNRDGAFIPGVALRSVGDTTTPGIIAALMLPKSDPATGQEGPCDVSVTDQDPPVTDGVTDKTQSSAGCDVCDGKKSPTRMGVEIDPTTPEALEASESDLEDPEIGSEDIGSNFTPIGVVWEKPVTSVTSSSSKGSIRHTNVTETSQPPPETSQTPDPGTNSWGLTPEQVAIAREVVANNPNDLPYTLEFKLLAKDIRLKSKDVPAVVAWLREEAA